MQEQDTLDRLMVEYQKQAEEDCRALERSQTRSGEKRKHPPLPRPLNEENKGYQLLTKMGYKEGQGLGVNEQGRSEPLPLPSKRNREGLGKKPRGKMKTGSKGTPSAKFDDVGYRQRLSAISESRKTTARLQSARRLIEDLDRRAQLECNPFWLPKQEDEVDSLSSMPVGDASSAALAYLREQHHYCFWCGCQYASAEEMSYDCPGDAEERH